MKKLLTIALILITSVVMGQDTLLVIGNFKGPKGDKGEPGRSPLISVDVQEHSDGYEFRFLSDGNPISEWHFLHHGSIEIIEPQDTLIVDPPDSVIVNPGDSISVTGSISTEVILGFGAPWQYTLKNNTTDTLTQVICNMTTGGRISDIISVDKPSDLVYSLSAWAESPASVTITLHSGLLPGQEYTIKGDNSTGPLTGWEFVVIGKKFTCIINVEHYPGVGPVITTIKQESGVHVATAVVTWNANTESDLAGYKVYYGTESGQYTISIDVGNVTQRKVSGLEVGGVYYFVVTAYDLNGNESAPSGQVAYSVVK